jgi:predicted RNase H-like HicB family nuclease
MLSEFINRQLGKAKYKILKDGSYFGVIPSVRGVWANSRSLENCRKELREVLEEWILLRVRNREEIPGFELKVDQRRLVRNH